MKFFDLHCDTLYRSLDVQENLLDGGMHVNLQRGRDFELWRQCMAIWIPDGVRGPAAMDLFLRGYELLKCTEKIHPDKIFQCADAESFSRTDAGCGAILTVEGGGVLGGKLENLDILHNCGVKMMTLTWNGPCELGDGVGTQNAGGLTEFGRAAVKRMEELKMIVDISHASMKIFHDIEEISTRPFVASHSNAKEICDHKRNLTRDQIRSIVHRGGLIGVNFAKIFLNSIKNPNIYDIIRHVEEILGLGGRESVCFGSDFDGTDMSGGITGIESISALREAFLHKNFNEDLVNDIFWGNANRFFQNHIFA